MQSSWWPVILRADSTSSRNVNLRVSILSWLITLSFILLAITSVVTPLGLSDAIKASNSRQVNFQYAPDRSAFGYGTSSCYNRFSRPCGDLFLTNCPGTYAGYDAFTNSTGMVHLFVDFKRQSSDFFPICSYIRRAQSNTLS